MELFKMIETTQNWTCLEDGIYQIVCVAGGQGGSNTVARNLGGATSFGNYLTASGNWAGNMVYGGTGVSVGGMGGWTLANYGGAGASTKDSSASLNGGGFGQNGIGHGSGGYGVYAGGCGKMTMTKVKLTKGEVVPCTIGTSGAIGGTDLTTSGNGANGIIVINGL